MSLAPLRAECHYRGARTAARIGCAAAAVPLMSSFPCHPHTDVESCLAKT